MSTSTDRDLLVAADKPTLYKQIRRDIEHRILTGEWPPGHRIPFEHQLMERYGCSRMTVNKALSELAQADLIERRRRAGTFVRRPKHLSAVLKIADIRAEIAALGRSYGYELILLAPRHQRHRSRASWSAESGQGDRDCLPPQCRQCAVRRRRQIDQSRGCTRSRHGGFCDRTAWFVAAPPRSMDGSRAYDQRHCRRRSHRGGAGHCDRCALPRDRPVHLAQRRTLTAVRLLYPAIPTSWLPASMPAERRTSTREVTAHFMQQLI